MRLSLVLIGAVLMAGCDGDGTGPDEDPVPVDPQAYIGTWRVDVQPGAECYTSGRSYWFVIEEDDAEGAVGSVQNVVSRWSRDSEFSDDDPLTGNLDHRNHTFELNFWLIILDIGDRFTGTVEVGPKLVGKIRNTRGACSTDASAVLVS